MQLLPHVVTTLVVKSSNDFSRYYVAMLGGGYFNAGFARSAIIALAARCRSRGARIICSPRRPALTLTRS